MQKFLFIFGFLFFYQPAGVEAKEYPIFDGQKYNGLYYPRIDIIEWGQPPHLEFHVYSKDEPIEIEAKAVERGGNRVLLVNYFFTKRKEKVCRSVIAPGNFSAETQLYFYKDGTDHEYDNIYVSVGPIPASKNIATYSNKPYTLADCNAENSDAVPVKDEKKDKAKDGGSKTSSTADSGSGSTSASTTPGRDVASSAAPTVTDSTSTSGVKPDAGDGGKKELIDYENNALPYNF